MVGLAGQQITWLEIGAYDRETYAGLSVWEKRLIRRLDDAYELAKPDADGKSKKPPSIADTKAALRAQIAARNAKTAAKGGRE